MRTPVIIAARNEERSIGRTLDTLAGQRQEVEPIVIVNDSIDRTADIAAGAGALVLESEAGKMRAIQAGLRYLGERALDPVLILDADSRPLSQKWSRRMNHELGGLPQNRPAIIWGPYVFSDDINPLLGRIVTASSMRVSWADRHDDDPRTIRGGNTGLRLQSDGLLEAMLELDNFWPREDVAIYDTAMEQDARKKVAFNPEAWVHTSGQRVTDTVKKLLTIRRHPSRVTDTTYATEAPADSRPYNSPHSRHKNKNPDAA